MASSSSNPDKLTLLSLTDDILGRIFNHLAVTTKYTLQFAIDAINLAKTNTRLRRIFSAQLTRITPKIENHHADSFSSEVFEALVRIAGENLRELHIPGCHHSYLRELPNICPNLEALCFVEHRHLSFQLCCSSDEDEGDGFGVDNSDYSENHFGYDDSSGDDSSHDGTDDDSISADYTNDHSISDHGVSDNDVTDDRENDSETSEDDSDKSDSSENESSVDKVCVNVASDRETFEDARESDASDQNTNQANNYSDDVGKLDDHSSDNPSCPFADVLLRSNIRKLSIHGLPRYFCESIMTKMVDHSLQELHLHSMRKNWLPLIMPLLSHPLRVLTVTMRERGRDTCEHISRFVDALTIAVSHISSVTIEFQDQRGRGPLINSETFEFPNQAKSLIASARQNACKSECTSIDLAGESTFRILSAVDRNASISLHKENITVCDRGESTDITCLPLHADALKYDITHLEKAYTLPSWYDDGEDLVEYGWVPAWGNHLAGHRLKLVTGSDAHVLSLLQLSTEVLQMRFSAYTSDWTFLKGVRELYLVDPISNFSDEEYVAISFVIEGLPRLIDAFHGELIWAEYCYDLHYPDENDCKDCPETERNQMVENANDCKDAIDRFVKRGGDAATLSRYIDDVLKNLKMCANNG